MDPKMWYVLTAFLLVSVRASRYDQGPQRFYDVSYDSITSEQNENKEVIVYLTPDQVKALEADGAVIRSAEEPENDEADSGLEAENNEQEETPKQEENEEAQQEKEAQPEEQENLDDIQDQDIDFEEILRILNEEQAEEEETEEAVEEQALNEPKIEEENTESPRNFSPRITVSEQLKAQEDRYLAPALAKKQQTLKSYSLIRYQPNEQPQSANIQLFQQQRAEPIEGEETSEEPQTEAPAQEKRKYKLIPYEVIETQEPEQIAVELPQQIAEEPKEESDDLVKVQRQNRIKSIIQELKASAKYNDQKYAIEIERLRASLQKQKAENVAKTAPALIKQQLNKKNNQNKSKPAKGEQATPQQLKFQKYSLPSTRPIAVPVMKSEKFEAQRPIPVPVETSKRVSVKNVYVRTRTDKPFIITRKVPENKRQPVEVPTSKPERITILRHIWEH